jgi:hypothetical protein
MKTMIIRLPDVEAAMLVEVQKTNKNFKDTGSWICNEIRDVYFDLSK